MVDEDTPPGKRVVKKAPAAAGKIAFPAAVAARWLPGLFPGKGTSA
jgi:hypothetical protein